MNKALLSAVAAAALFPASAMSATLVLDDNSLDNKIKVFSDATHPDTGSTVFGITTEESELIRFASDQTIHVTGGSGYAWVADADTATDWLMLDISPDDSTFGFTALSFSIKFDGKFVGNGNGNKPDPGYLTVTANLLGGGSEIFTFADLSALAFENQGLKDFLLEAEGDQIFTSVRLSGTDPFFQIKQVDIGLTPIPEPAAWAMMIAGFGLVGGAARRARLRHTVAA